MSSQFSNRKLPVLYAAATEDMKVEYTSDDRDSADAYAFACKLKVFAYLPQTREASPLVSGRKRYVYLDCHEDGSPNFDEEGTVYGISSATGGPDSVNFCVYVPLSDAQGPAMCGTCRSCKTDEYTLAKFDIEPGERVCLVWEASVPDDGFCHIHQPKEPSHG